MNSQVAIRDFDCGIIVFDSGNMTADSLRAGLDAIDMKELMPDMSKYRRGAFASACEELGRHFMPPQRDARKIEVHKLDRKKIAFEVVSIEMGQNSNEHKFLFSFELNDNGTVSTVAYDKDNVPKFESQVTLIESALENGFHSALQVVPTSVVTKVVNNILDKLHGFRLRMKGGAYVVSSNGLPIVEQFAGHVPKESRLNIRPFSISIEPTHDNFARLANDCKHHMDEELKDVEAQLQELGEKEQRSNGAAKRTARCQAVLDMASEFRDLIGDKFEHYKSMCEKVQDAVDAASVMEVCS